MIWALVVVRNLEQGMPCERLFPLLLARRVQSMAEVTSSLLSRLDHYKRNGLASPLSKCTISHFSQFFHACQEAIATTFKEGQF